MKESFPSQNASENLPSGTENPAKKSYENLSHLLEEISKQERLEAKEFRVSTLNKEEKDSFERLGQEIHDFNGLFFDEEENDVAVEYEVALERNLSKFYATRNEKGKIMALLNSQFVESGPNNENMSMVIWYVATHPDYQSKGLALSLYKEAYQDFLANAQAKSKAAYGIFGETVDEVEGYLNKKFGRSRMYIERQDGNLEEVYYASPPAHVGAEATPEHFMGRTIAENQSMSTAEYLDLARSIYGEFLKPDYFEQNTSEEYAEYQKSIDGILEAIRAQLEQSKDGQIYFLSKSEREAKEKELVKSGKSIVGIKEEE